MVRSSAVCLTMRANDSQSTNVVPGSFAHGRLAGKNAIITGAAGYAYRHLDQSLLYSKMNARRLQGPPNIHCLYADLRVVVSVSKRPSSFSARALL